MLDELGNFEISDNLEDGDVDFDDLENDDSFGELDPDAELDDEDDIDQESFDDEDDF